VAVAHGLPIPAADEILPDEQSKRAGHSEAEAKSSPVNINNLTIPISSRSHSFNSETSSNLSPTQPTFATSATTLPSAPQTSSLGSALSRGRAKTLASLTSSKSTQPEQTPREMSLPIEPNVYGQRVEAYLYKDASECPICFLYYPPYLNKTRCCDQAICSECFVQIKRPDPHPPEHVDPSAPPPPPTESEGPEDELVSEPAACPFCVQPEFGITYDPPPLRRGLAYANQGSGNPLNGSTSAMSSMSSLVSGTSIDGRISPTNAARRRTTSVSAQSPSVITTDKVRPDWHQKLAAARAHTARRSAAATALHTAAYLMGTRGHEADSRAFGGFGRRGLLRRTSGADSPSGGSSSGQMSTLALMSERASAQARLESGAYGEGEPPMTPGPRGSSRRGRMDDLEDMMMMEAIRLSLASEEDRRKKEEKESKKEAKKKEKEREKEAKKAGKLAGKLARKTGVYPTSANASTSALEEPSEGSGKGKAPSQREPEPSLDQGSYLPPPVADPQSHLERARAQLQPEGPLIPGRYLYKPSHLRTLSNASSSASSVEESAQGSLKGSREASSSMETSPHASGLSIPVSGAAQKDSYISGTPPGGGAGTESMFNFRSLAAMVGEDEKARGGTHMEDAGAGHVRSHQRGDSSASVGVHVGQGGIGTPRPY